MRPKTKAALVAAAIVATLFAMQIIAWASVANPPSASHTFDPAPTAGGWIATSESIATIAATEGVDGDDLAHVDLDINGTSSTRPASGATVSVDVTVPVSTVTTFSYSVVDVAGGRSETQTVVLRRDAAAPVTTWTANPPVPASGYTSVTVTPSITTTDNGESGVASLAYRVNGGVWETTTTTTTVTLSAIATEGATALEFSAADAVGNKEATKTAMVRIDKTVPTATIDATATYGAAAVATITASDPTSAGVSSGIASICYRIDNGATQTVSSAVATIGPVSQLGTHTVLFWAVDRAGNQGTPATTTFVVKDLTPPVSTMGTLAATWVSTDVTVSVTATDNPGGSGVAALRYSLNGAPDATLTTQPFTFVVSADGTNTILYRAVDASGNVEATRTAIVLIDKTPPVGPSTLNYSSLTDTAVHLVWSAASDARSGVAYYEVYDGTTLIATTTALSATVTSLTPGAERTFTVKAVDRVGLSSAGAALVVTVPGAGVEVPVPVGTSVLATLPVPAGGLSGSGSASVVFSNVTAAGMVKLVRIAAPPASAPTGLRFLGDHYDLSFTGTFTGTIQVRLPYDPRIPAGRAGALGVQHWTGSAWESVPVTVDATNHVITFTLTSLSPLSVTEPATTNTVATLTSLSTYFPAYGRASNVTVRLADATNESLDGFTVQLQRFAGGQWTTVATMAPVVGVPGAYRAAAAPVGGVRTLFRATLVANALYTAADKPFAVIPQAKLSTPKASTTRPRANRVFYVSGSVAPRGRLSGRLEVQKLVRGRWVNQASISFTTATTGAYRKAVKLKAGTYRMRAVYGANTATARNALTRSAYSSRMVVR